ncbi:ubiquitin-like-conjugating enzyme ATG10 [Cheilinus undulatus]|uniref:ubiquitin-like-conjugating enzyme ATG10 n=1 Tax=Cheilinus undulatus TaxID=241271 RepID=UPI001BD3CDFF|nr:ubiquitin-like-conjugating enzyme ATG10 [Cheilinus undulatus]
MMSSPDAEQKQLPLFDQLSQQQTINTMSFSVLDEQSFLRCCRLLLQQSETLNDGWSWEEVQGSKEGYLKKTAVRSVLIDSSTEWDLEGSNPALNTHTCCLVKEEDQSAAAPGDEDDEVTGDMEDEDDDGVCVQSAGSSVVLQYEYHILFSCSYGTPVLYFRATTLEGRSLSLEEVWSSVHPNFRLRLQTSPLNAITLQEHPLLGQPFFMLHPCRTEEFMKPVLQAAHQQQRAVNYVLSWLSVVAPLVGLEVPLKYCTSLHPAASPD